MSALTRGEQRTYLNLLIGDVSATNPELTDARKNLLLDEWHAWVWEAFGPRLLQIPSVGSSVNDGTLTLTSDFVMTTTRTDMVEILSVHFEGTDSTSVNGAILDRISYAELMRRRAKSTTAGTPVAACWFRQQNLTGSPTGTNNGKWRVMVHPPVGASARYFSVIARREVTPYSGDGSTPDVTPMESRLIPRGAAVEACYKIGRGDRAKRLARLLPQVMRTALEQKLAARAA